MEPDPDPPFRRICRTPTALSLGFALVAGVPPRYGLAAASTNHMAVIHRGSGKTPTERYLANLADHTFLDLWSYPNVFNDKRPQPTAQGRSFATCWLFVIPTF